MYTMLRLPQYELMQYFAFAFVSVLIVTWFELRPLGAIFLLALGCWIFKTQCVTYLVIPPELQRNCVQFIERVRDLRQNKPKMFCAVTCSCLGALAVLGHLISGTSVVLISLVIAALISTKYNFKLINLNAKDYEWSSQLNTENEEDFTLDDNESNMFVLERACDLTTLSLPVDLDDDEEHSDEVPSDFMLPDNSLNDIADDRSSNIDVDIDDLLPITNDDTNNKTIEFKRGHFKRDSSLSTTSSSSEESLSKGLQFPDLSVVDAAKSSKTTKIKINPTIEESKSTILAKSANFIPDLVSNLVQWTQNMEPTPPTNSQTDVVDAMTSKELVKTNILPTNSKLKSTDAIQQECRLVTALDSSDESDFEILQEDELEYNSQ